MDDTIVCPDGQHHKVFAPYVLLSEPPQYPWICRRCLAVGVDRGQANPFNEYGRLMKQRKSELAEQARNMKWEE